MDHGPGVRPGLATLLTGSVKQKYRSACTVSPTTRDVCSMLMTTTIILSTKITTSIVHTSAKARLTNVAIRIRIRIWIKTRDSDMDPDRHQNLIICWPITTLAENFMQIRSEVFAQSC